MKQRLLSLFAMLSLMINGAMAQSLTVADITAEAGQEATITVAIEGAAEMTALQFNLSLPEGFALAGDITLGAAAQGHTLSTNALASGDLLVVLYSLQQASFADGTLVTIPVVAAEDAASGEARLYTVHAATAAAVSHTLSNVAFAMNIASEEPEPETKYYWYAGTTDPTTMTSIDPIIPADAASYVYGWTEITETPTEIKVAKESSNWQETGLFPDVQWYMACPSEYEFNTTYNGIQVGGWYVTRNAVSIGDVEYDVWKCMALTDAVYTQLAKVGDPVSNPEPTPEPEGLSTSKYYRVKNVTTGLYLQVEGNNTNMKLQNKAEGLAMMQIFGLEDAGEGMYYITAADADSRYYAHASSWNFNATTNAEGKTPFTIALVEGEEGVYTLHQSVALAGLAGADNSEAGSPVYCNKGIDNNGKWAFEALTAEEQAAYVATLTAAAKPALEAAIAHAEAVVSTRSAVLSADEVAAINAAVATAKAEKDNTADVGVLNALTEAINAAVNEAIYVWNLDALSNTVCYAVSTEDRGAWYSQSENLTSTTKAGVAFDITDSKQLFAFVKSAATGAYYLYSVSEKKFVKAEGQYTALAEAPAQAISFLEGTRSAKYPWVVALNAEDGEKMQMGISNGYDPAVITFWNDLGDGGNTVRIEKAATFDVSEALAAIGEFEKVEVAVSGITLDHTAATLTEGESVTLVATVSPADATDKTVTWETSDAAVATVENGVVTAVAAGTATITAKAGEHSATCVVTVEKKVIAVSGITLDQTAVTLTEGESVTLVATVSPADATDQTVTWETSDAAVATVENGVVTAVAAGTATITAKAGEHSATCVVTVEKKEEPFTGITAISELSNTVLYAVSQPNHSNGATSWAVQEGGQALKSSYDLGLSVDGEDARQQFAFVSNDGGTTLYLYHAAEAKFVAKDGSLGSKPVDAIQFKAGAYDNTFVAYFDDAHYINVGGGSQMIIDSWNIADGGNSCVIVPVGEFDPTEALKAFENEDTGIENPEFNNQKSELIYDLTGRKVLAPQKGGVYVVNGRKVVY